MEKLQFFFTLFQFGPAKSQNPIKNVIIAIIKKMHNANWLTAARIKLWLQINCSFAHASMWTLNYNKNVFFK